MNNNYDLIVIGAGPGGYNAALEASKGGLSTLLIEKEKVGGTCLNSGCIPTKSFYASSNLINQMKKSEELGITSSYSFDYQKILERKNSVVKTLGDGIKFALEKAGVAYLEGEAKLISNNEVKVNDEVFEAKNIIIATGSRELIIPIKGCEYTVSSKDILDLETLPNDLVVIGGGVIGVELASILSLMGVSVTIIELQKNILPNLDLEISRRLTSYLKQLGVKIITGSSVVKVEKDKVHYVTNDKETVIDASLTLMAIGRRPNIENLGLEEVGINFNKRGIEVDSHFETNIKGIYAIGDVNGKVLLAHYAEASGKKVVDEILNRENHTNFDLVPSVVFTFPEVASCGVTEEYLKENNISYQANKVLYRSNGKALASGEVDGFLKVLTVDEKIVGVHIIGHEASLLIHEASILMNNKTKVTEAKDYIFAHPTLSEIFRDGLK